jgi:hypothetical protein
MHVANIERPASGDAAASGLWWDGRALHLLDQTKLPARECWLRCCSVEDVARAIERLTVRGAPAIAAAAAYGLVLAIEKGSGGPPIDGHPPHGGESRVGHRWRAKCARGGCD